MLAKSALQFWRGNEKSGNKIYCTGVENLSILHLVFALYLLFCILKSHTALLECFAFAARVRTSEKERYTSRLFIDLLCDVHIVSVCKDGDFSRPESIRLD